MSTIIRITPSGPSLSLVADDGAAYFALPRQGETWHCPNPALVIQARGEMLNIQHDGKTYFALPTGSSDWLCHIGLGGGPGPGPGPGGWMHPLGGKWPWTTYEDGGGSHSAGALDFPCGTSTPPLYAATSGPIIYAGWEDGGGGNVVIIRGPDGEGITYAHLSRIDVSVGQNVSVGDVVGLVGTTGQSSGNHLHLEVRRNGTQWGPWYRALDYFASKGIEL